jgi:uncharacterized protein (TIGR01244 family)
MTAMTTSRSFHSQAAAMLATLTLLVGCSSPTADTTTAESSSAPQRAADSGTDAAPGETATPAELREADLGTTNNVHAVGNLYLAGQPAQDDIDALVERGVKTVVCLRKPEEVDYDEAASVEAAGMAFVSIPFDTAEELTDDVFDRVRATLAEHGDEPLVLHCGRANRVGAVWMVHRVLNEGVGIDQALKEAQTAGLRTPEYIERAKDYIERARSEKSSNKPADQTPAAD